MTVAESPEWAGFRRAEWEAARGECWICEKPVPLDEMQLDGGWDGNRFLPKHPDCRRNPGAPRAKSTKGQLRLFEVARLYGLSSETLKEWAMARVLPRYRNGNYGHYWVRLSDAEKIVAELMKQRANATEP